MIRPILLSLLLSLACVGPPPERVVDQAAQAAARGDKAAFVALFTPRSRQILAYLWGVMEREQPALARLAAGDVTVVAGRPYAGGTKMVVNLREGGQEDAWVLHVHHGVWRIDLPDSFSATRRLGDLRIRP